MIRTAEDAIYALSERTTENRKQLRQQNLQRRSQITDLYGTVLHAQGDANNPAEFYISVSPDLQYYERFQFKLNIQPYLAAVTGATEQTSINIGNTSLTVAQGAITPNPHTHTNAAHTHTVVKGISKANMSADTFSISVDGVPITEYLIEQHGGDWIEGVGLYPGEAISDDNDIEDFYDILDVASVMMAESGGEAKKTKLLRPGFKKVAISGNGFFSVDMYLYLKYSFNNQ